MRALVQWIWARLSSDDGMATVEYVVVTLAAAAVAGVLFTVVTGQSVATAIAGLIQRALSVQF